MRQSQSDDQANKARVKPIALERKKRKFISSSH